MRNHLHALISSDLQWGSSRIRNIPVRGLLSLVAILALNGTLPAQQTAGNPAATAAATTTDPVLLRVNEAVRVTKMRNLDFQRHTPWQILHGLLALREHYTVKNGSQFVNALEFLSTEARYKGEGWFQVTPYGAKAHPYNGTPYDFEGHVNQTLSIIAMCNVPLTHTFKTHDGRTVTMADMVRHAQMAVSTKEELTWTLWFLTHYLDQDTTWTNAAGEQWSMEALVRNQNAASVLTAPCGGCHNLFALAYARNSYMQKHGKLTGAWLEADNKIQQYISTAQVMQNRDGSFATQYFKSRGYSTDFNERIKSSGHMLEWLMVALPKSRLNENWVRLGVQTLANDLIQNATQPADCGPLYHSLHALVLYQQRMGVPLNGPVEQSVAKPSTGDAKAAALPNLSAPGDSTGTIVPSAPQAAVAEAAPASAESTEVSPSMPSADASGKLAPTSEPLAPLTKASPTKAPALVTPPATSAEKPVRNRGRLLDQNQEPRRPLRRLSSEGEGSEVVPAAPAVMEQKEPRTLTPVQGGMPIFKPEAAIPVAQQKMEKTESPVSEVTESTATEPEKKAETETSPDKGTDVAAEKADEKTSPAAPEKTEVAEETASSDAAAK